MSRICVKNLGKSASEKQLREIFSSKGEVTDVKLITTKDGQSRRFAFVGFRTELQAAEAQKHFNNTFIGLSRISVEIARKFNDQSLQESKQKIAMKKKGKLPHNDEIAKEVEALEDNVKNLEKNKVVGGNSLLAVDTTSVAGRKKAEFLEMMKSRKNTNKWANDDVAGTGTALDADQLESSRNFVAGSVVGGSVSDKDSESDSESDSDSDEDVNYAQVEASGEPLATKEHVSDLDYLKSKIARKRSDSAFSESSGSSSGDEKESGDDVEERNIQRDGRSKDKSTDDQQDAGNGEDHMDNRGNRDNNSGGIEDGDEEPEDARLFVKNLPFSCTEEEFTSLFKPFGPISEIHLPLDEEKRGKGYGFIQFMLPEHADAALAGLSGEAFQGRVLYVVRAMKPKEKDPAAVAALRGNKAKLSSFQLKKEEERRKAMNRKEGWNSAFVRSDAVVDSLASRHGVSSSDILDTTRSGGDLAVRLAIGEAQVVMENREYFALHGIDVDALESTHSSQKAAARSTTTLLVKNLPPTTVPEELESMFARFGSIAAFLAPPSKTMVVVDFIEPSEARAAQKGLAYRSYKHTPLYLEWAPVHAIDRKKAAAANRATGSAQKTDAVAGSSSSGAGVKKENKSQSKLSPEDEDDQQQYSSLFIKNLNFSTTEINLKDHLLHLGVEGLRTVLIQKKLVGKNMLSQGYGFAEFKSPDCAARALAKLKGSLLDSHALEVKPSDKRLTTAPASAARSLLSAGANNNANNTNNKLIVRNVAFQATKAEIRDLFAAYGSVKRVRIPKKMGGEHRGFAFVDFSTGQEAALAMASLRNTHLYGRHLVLEWAKEEDEQEGDIQGLEGFNLGGTKRSAATAAALPLTALDKLRKKARQDERVIHMQSEKRAGKGVQDMLEGGNGGVGSDDV